jgi:2-oxoisovalerate dehydrogenase E1 component
MKKEQFYPVAYYYMLFARRMEDKFKELYKKSYLKGTVIICTGNEATAVGMSIPFRPGQDVLSLMHRDFSAHLTQKADPFTLMCQYMANAQSPTHGREGNVHHGNVPLRRFPMISHLGNMVAPTVGGVWAARNQGKKVFGLTTIGDGSSSTGDVHESLNLASVLKVPVLVVIENNHYAYSTPTRNQYNCKNLSDRAVGYGIEGKTVDGTDVWEVYNAVCDALEGMESDSLPRIIEAMTLRLEGHAVYDNAEYVSAEERAEWMRREPLQRTQATLFELGYTQDDLDMLDEEIKEEITLLTNKALACSRPDPASISKTPFAPRKSSHKVKPYAATNVRNQNAVTAALDYILQEDSGAFLCGQDIGVYGSPFKTCKGLFEKFGPQRVIDLPICESASTGFCLGASQIGKKPIMEFQFADFSTEAVTQLGLNAGTWHFRTEQGAPLLFRFPCGGGLTLGPFHSSEYEGLWSQFPGLKIIYPFTAQEHFEALVAGFYDPNPCLVFEHKKIYWNAPSSIDFDGNLDTVFRPRKYTDGTDLTIIAYGAILESILSVVSSKKYSATVWNPFILSPLEIEPIIESVKATGKVLVIQESGGSTGSGNRIISHITQACFHDLKCAPVLLSAPDMPVPFAKELEQQHIPGIDIINKTIGSIIGVQCE